MQYILSRQFEKDFATLPKNTKAKTIEVLSIFVKEPDNPILRIHPLKGKWVGHFSVDVTGDTRAIYFIIEDDLVRFVAIVSHSKLYGK